MTVAAIRQALETRLLAMAGALPAGQTEYENVLFKPTAKVPYWQIHFLFARPENPSFDNKFHRQRGFMQVTLRWPVGGGVGDAAALADSVQLWFPPALSLTANSVTTIVDGTPEISAGRIEGDRWVLPIRVRFFANVQGG